MSRLLRNFIEAHPDQEMIVQHQNGLHLEEKPNTADTLSVVEYEGLEYVYGLRADFSAIKFFAMYGRVVELNPIRGIVKVVFVTGRKCNPIKCLVQAQEGHDLGFTIIVNFAHRPRDVDDNE